MRPRRIHRPRKRSHSLLWIVFGLFGAGLLALLWDRREPGGDRDAEPEPHPAPEPEPVYPEAAPPESVPVWIAGPAGNLYLRDGGATGTLPILFLHSLGGNGGQWALQLDHLRRRRRAVALDFRGHGDSDPAENGAYAIPDLVGDVEAAVDQLGLRHFVLAGHSLGAAVAIEYAGKHPGRVSALLLADPNGDPTLIPREQIDPFLAAVREDPLGEVGSYFRQLVAGGDRDAGRWVLEDLQLTHEAALTAALTGAMEHSPLPALARYKGPTLAILSDMNSLPYSLHRQVPGLATRLMHGTGHWLMMDRPEIFNHLLDEFLDAVEGTA
ncbi:MAG TPA: alpha/beta hydrolase [Acidobacteria bacterium]|nr:alpha/beta hydrolase [Acidobacteriota bacterium]